MQVHPHLRPPQTRIRDFGTGVKAQYLIVWADAVFRSLSQQEFYTSARSVGCYLSMQKGELQTDRIVEDLLARGVKVYTPYLPPPPPSSTPSPQTTPTPTAQSTMSMLRLYSTADLNACPLDKWGILDPGLNRRDTGETREDALDTPAPDLDVIIIPGVAFDDDCNRLGRGKAYYDRYLSLYTSTRKSPLLVALALTPQLLPPDQTVPTTPDDFTLHAVITPERFIQRKGGGQGRPAPQA